MTENSRAGRMIRAASRDDARLIWEWANDPSVRANAFNPEPIPWDQHLGWYERRLAAPTTRFWILEADGVPVGQIRYDRDPDGSSAEISFSVAGEHRGRGYGTDLIRMTCARAAAELDVEEITALVFDTNPASSRAFFRAGFTTLGISEVHGKPCYRFSWHTAGPEGRAE